MLKVSVFIYYYERLNYDKIIFWSDCYLFFYPQSHNCYVGNSIIPVYFMNATPLTILVGLL